MTLPTHLVSGLLQTERQSDGRRRLLRDLVVAVDGLIITIPAETLTDFSSIPWFGRILVRWSKVDIAGVVHDWLYRTAFTSRTRSDKIWRLVAVAGEHHANTLQAWVGWLALRVGGWVVWRRLRNQDASSQAPNNAE